MSFDTAPAPVYQGVAIIASGIGIYHPRVATRRGRPGNVRKGKVVIPALSGFCIKALSGWGITPCVLAMQKVDTGVPVDVSPQLG